MIYGYCRISTDKQNIERQERNILKAYPKARIYKEAYTGTKIDRPMFTKLLKKVKEGDTIVFDSVSRMSRDASEGFKLYEELFNKGIVLMFLKEPQINTETYQNALNNSIHVEIKLEDKATDNFINGMLKLVSEYTMELAKRQIELAFEQSQKEVDDLHQRTKEGIETARRNGKQIGRPTISVNMEELKSRVSNGESVSQVCKSVGISRAYYYNCVRKDCAI